MKIKRHDEKYFCTRNVVVQNVLGAKETLTSSEFIGSYDARWSMPSLWPQRFLNCMLTRNQDRITKSSSLSFRSLPRKRGTGLKGLSVWIISVPLASVWSWTELQISAVPLHLLPMLIKKFTLSLATSFILRPAFIGWLSICLLFSIWKCASGIFIDWWLFHYNESLAGIEI